MNGVPFSRRQFVASLALAAPALAAPSAAPIELAAKPRLKLGLDNFSLRAMRWRAEELIDYAASLRLDSLFITDLKPFANFTDAYLRELRARAADKSLELWLGSWSICPTSKAFRKDWGTAEEHLALGIRMAKALGSPIFRVILGTGEDRHTEGGIQARIRDTVKVCQALRSQARDAGIKIAVENHAGDMQAFELVQLIETAGPDFVGANLDSGNATWTMEDPLASLEILAPCVLCTSLRDSAVWESDSGATVQWTAMGEGSVDWKTYFQRFAQLCPKVPVHLETISGFNREIPYFKPDFWNAWPEARARDFARFLALAVNGKPRKPYQPPPDKDPQLAQQEYQRSELERSLEYCRRVLGLGVKT